MLRHRRLLAFGLTAAAVAAGLSAVRPAAPPTVVVPVAAHDLAAGAVIGPGDLATVALPPGAAPAGVVPTPVGRTLAGPMRRGEPLTDARLLGPALTATQPGLVAMPVRLTDAAMAGVLHVGDRVLLLVTEARSGSTRPVADGVTVLAMPTVPGDPGGVTNDLPGRLIVVGVPQDLVAAVTSASVRGFLTFAYDR